MKRNGTKDLTLTQRRQLEMLIKAGIHKKQIAKLLGVCLTTVYNELKRGRCVQKVLSHYDCIHERVYKLVTVYCADVAEQRYRVNQSSHGAPLKIGNDYDFVREIETRVVDRKLSPGAALGEVKRIGLCSTSISKTTLYRYIRLGYIFPRITMQHAKLKHRYMKTTIKRPPRGTSIEQRPCEISDRNTFGHWEMDCVIGKKFTKDTLLVLTERFTRYEIILKMPNRKATTVVQYLNKLELRFGKMFRQIFKSITVDNGSEFSDFSGLEKSIYGGKRTSVFYCHPYTACERGSNERLNRDIRRLIPKSSDLTAISEKRVRDVETWINSYPREIFGFATSAELFAAQLQAL